MQESRGNDARTRQIVQKRVLPNRSWGMYIDLPRPGFLRPLRLCWPFPDCPRPGPPGVRRFAHGDWWTGGQVHARVGRLRA